MKNIKYMAALLPLIVILTGCSNDPKDEPPVVVETFEIALRGMLPSLGTFVYEEPEEEDVPETRAMLDLKDLGFEWSVGDDVGLWYVPQGTGENAFANTKYTLKRLEKEFADFSNSRAAYWAENASGHVFYSIYPYNAETAGDLKAVAVNLPALQPQGTAEVPAENIGLLYARKEYSEARDMVFMEYSYPVALLELKIDATNTVFAGEILTSLEASFENEVNGNATINVETGIISGGDGKEIIMSYPSPQRLSSIIAPCVFLYPQESSQTDFTLSFSTELYDVTMEITLPFSLEANVLHEFEVDVERLIAEGKAGYVYKGVLPEPLSADANSFVIKPGSTVQLPVSRAFDVWREYFGVELAGIMSASLLWQDTPSLIESIVYVPATEARESSILITTGGGLEGNAVIEFTADESIRWSWHLWVTNYDPEEAAGHYVNPSNGVAFMDRNLGATSAAPGDVNSLGLMYQWGRKDPLPGPRLYSFFEIPGTYDSRYLYNMNNEQFYQEDPDMNIGVIRLANPFEYEMLETVVKYPFSFFFGNEEWGDWYSYDEVRNDHLWNDESDNKGLFDPCPEGWRVPPYLDGVNPWAGITANNIPMSLEPGDIDAYDGSRFQTDEGEFMGNYLYTGMRDYSGLTFTLVGRQGRYWCSTNSVGEGYGDSVGIVFVYNDTSLSISTSNRAMSAGVRCVKE